MSFDAVVIGSGAGGAPAAKELAEGGMRVALVEEGPHVAISQLTARPRDMVTRLYRDAGQTLTLGNPPIALPVGRAVGGSTLVNSGTCFRAGDHVLARWRDELGLESLGPGSLDDCYGRVERVIGVSEVSAELAGRNALIARRGAQALGWSGGFMRRNAVGCVGSGVCAFGCPRGAKQHMGATYVPLALAAGAELRTGAAVTRIVMRGRRAVAVELGSTRVRADRVIVAAGTLHTPGLLAASGLGLDCGRLGHNLSIHPATAVWARMDETVDMARGVPQSYFVDQFSGEGIMLEGVAGPPDYLAMAAPFTGPRHRELMLGYRRIAQFGAMVSDSSRGRVALGRFGRRAGIIRYDLNRDDVRKVKRAIELLAELMFAAGAVSVITPIARARELAGGDLSPLSSIEVSAAELKLMAFHPLGTASGCVDADGLVHGTDNVYVCDGSAVPTALGVNPQLTIMALATRLAFNLLGESVPTEEPDRVVSH